MKTENSVLHSKYIENVTMRIFCRNYLQQGQYDNWANHYTLENKNRILFGIKKIF